MRAPDAASFPQHDAREHGRFDSFETVATLWRRLFAGRVLNPLWPLVFLVYMIWGMVRDHTQRVWRSPKSPDAPDSGSVQLTRPLAPVLALHPAVRADNKSAS